MESMTAQRWISRTKALPPYNVAVFLMIETDKDPIVGRLIHLTEKFITFKTADKTHKVPIAKPFYWMAICPI
jgi:hypothetical protein